MKRFAISEKPSLNLVGVETAEVASDVDVGAVDSVVAVLVEVEGAIFAGPFEVERVRWRNILATWKLVRGGVDVGKNPGTSSRQSREASPFIARDVYYVDECGVFTLGH
jgi:hypothetical protein